ncbi:hypothetical protein FKP32DRAFT_1560428 [Trametes sanguinea]|nr:hypothetical protein FKP32DRAFT_1560428 [Trametes sanguinea]
MLSSTVFPVQASKKRKADPVCLREGVCFALCFPQSRAEGLHQLPKSLALWRSPAGDEYGENAIWNQLHDFLLARGYTLWRHVGFTYYAPPRDMDSTCNGFAYAPVHLGSGPEGRVRLLSEIDCLNGLTRPARATDGRDVVIRVISIGSEGRNHLDVLEYISRGLTSQVAPNHAIPLLEVFELEDITFGVFPRIGGTMTDAYESWAENSVGDIVDMMIQCLEALAYLHSIRVAHRDAFRDNFLVQWHPESMSPKQLTVTRPRVILNDFETAVRFDEDVPLPEMVCVGLPLSESFIASKYTRPVPAEVASGRPYDPFKLDVWQFAQSFSNLKTTIPKLDTVLSAMADDNSAHRPSALGAMMKLAEVVASIPPDTLKIPPLVHSRVSRLPSFPSVLPLITLYH